MAKSDASNNTDAPPHTLPPGQVLAHWASSEAGLNEQEAARRLARYGTNQLPTAARDSLFKRFMLQFHNTLIYVLLGAAGFTAVLEQWVDMAAILAVVLANAVLGVAQEGKAERAIDAIRSLLTPNASVIRDGTRCTIPAEQLVPGDMVFLEAGDRIPADLRLIQEHGLMTEEAILTGESLPAEKQTDPVSLDSPLGDRHSMAYSGTLVTAGQGQGIVVATGTHTELGRISGLLEQVRPVPTPLLRQMNTFGRWLSGAILAVALLILMYGYFVQTQPFPELFMAVVGLTVAAIPEGLPAVLSITLAVGVQAMARRHAIVRHLPAIETVGAVSVICTDKTGTLTRNEMMVATLAVGTDRFNVDGDGYSPQGDIRLGNITVDSRSHPALSLVARAAVLCNNAHLVKHDTQWVCEGDPMEGALLALATKIGGLEPQPPGDWQRNNIIPFDARHRWMATLHQHPGGEAAIFLKGAPEAVLDYCDTQLDARGENQPVDMPAWQSCQKEIAAKGQRVLALAFKPVSLTQDTLTPDDVSEGMTLIGLVGFIDPPRPEAITAVKECHQAGIQVKMITGDHPGTATAIARQVGLADANRVLTGQDLDGMDDEMLATAIQHTHVFARTSPEHKLRLVMTLQGAGLTVAMTGDGVNDAPALKRADIGIAMGHKGCEATREAADLVLTDDNFASIVAAVREGRTVYDNLKKVIGWALPTSIGEAMTILIALFLGLTLPITPVQILWVNLITAITLGIALAFEPGEESAMTRPPRQRDEPLLRGVLLWTILMVSALFLAAVYGVFSHALEKGYSIELARTMAVNTLVVLEVFYLFFMRNFYTTSLNWKALTGTPAVWLALAFVIAGQCAITYIPVLQRVFETRTISLLDGALILSVGTAVFLIIELEKQIRLRLAGRSFHPPHA